MIQPSPTQQVMNGPDLFSYLLDQVHKSDIVRFAVAFWGIGACEKLGLVAGKDVRVVCNLRLGGTNPREIRTLMKFARVRHYDRLHSKLYLFDQAGAIGSSNVSVNGLSYQDVDRSGWFETNVVFGAGDTHTQAEQAFNAAWESSSEITPEDLKTAEDAWSTRRFRLPIEAKTNTLLEAALTSPEAFSDRRIYVWFSPDPFSEVADLMVKEKQDVTRLGSDLSAFEVFPGGMGDVPCNADIICFSEGPRGGLSDGEVWSLPLELETSVVPDDSASDDTKNHLVFCTRAQGIGRFTKFFRKEWKPLIASIAENEGRGAFVELGHLLRRVR